jgi:hypothetical protein
MKYTDGIETDELVVSEGDRGDEPEQRAAEGARRAR